MVEREPLILHVDRHRPSNAAVRRIARVLRNGGCAVLPTETRYALCCDATSEEAIETVRRIKGRHRDVPFSIFLPGYESLSRWRIELTDGARKLARRFWPGPLTLILPTRHRAFRFLGATKAAIGVRVTPEATVDIILHVNMLPLVATSANPSGETLTSERENRWLSARAHAGEFLWARPPRYVRHRASTVIDCTGAVPRELRAGPITKAMWNAALYDKV